MKNKIGIIALTMLLIMSTAFGQGVKDEASRDTITIGVSKIVAHPALDAIEQGMVDFLAEKGYSITYDSQNANGDISTATSIAHKFKADKVDLVVGIGTPTAQALANVFDTTPVLFGGITDPLEAGLVPTYEPNSGNVGGASDKNPVFEQIRVFSEITGAKRIGIIFTSGEANGVQLKDLVVESCEKLGLTSVTTGISNSSEVKQAALAIIPRVDAIYVGTDNTVVSAITSISDVCKNSNKPFFTADPTSAEGLDYFMVWGFNYYQHGRKTGEAVDQVLSGKKTAGEVGTLFSTDPTEFELYFNLDVASRLGINIDQKYLDSAKILYTSEKQ
ncbi:MAG: ABC transporter substrate-binding protein [Bacteroidales bacterium]|jgi:putative ABC transport system substrate-binding protein|nr:ABC transporter substrate-binding protein [Bacteroidales bacterium]